MSGFIFLALLVPVVTIIAFLLFWQPEDFDVKPTFLKPDVRHTQTELSPDVREQFTQGDILLAPP